MGQEAVERRKLRLSNLTQFKKDPVRVARAINCKGERRGRIGELILRTFR